MITYYCITKEFRRIEVGVKLKPSSKGKKEIYKRIEKIGLIPFLLVWYQYWSDTKNWSDTNIIVPFSGHLMSTTIQVSGPTPCRYVRSLLGDPRKYPLSGAWIVWSSDSEHISVLLAYIAIYHFGGFKNHYGFFLRNKFIRKKRLWDDSLFGGQILQMSHRYWEKNVFIVTTFSEHNAFVSQW